METVFNMVEKPEKGNTLVTTIKDYKEYIKQPPQRPTPPGTPPTIYFIKNQEDHAEIEHGNTIEV